jgi:hypothetical protein
MSKKDNKATAETTAPEATLTLQDLTLVANIVDLAVQRGAFKGAEAETVGKQFNKLVDIIKAIAPSEDDTEETTAE